MPNIRNARFKAPKLRVSRTTVNRGRSVTKHYTVPIQTTSTSVARSTCANYHENTVTCGNDNAAETECNKKGTYSDRKKRVVEQWSEIRTQVSHARIVYESHHIVDERTCVECEIEPGCIRCYDCGPTYWSCEQCCLNRHKVSPLHVTEILKGEVFVQHISNRNAILNPSSHECDCPTKDSKAITVYDGKGRLHYVQIFWCKCIPLSVSLVRCGFWPAMPENPSVGFAWDLLEMLRALMLECQISVQGFCRALRCKSNLTDSECNTLYRFIINESFEEFRHVFYRLQSFRDVCPLSDDGTFCPCCHQNPSDSEELFVALFDGNAGLVRKGNSGKSYEPPKYGSLLFDDDDDTENFVVSYSDQKTGDHGVCNDFKAGDKLRSVVATKKLSVTGIFGTSCKHDIPIRFVNMKHGERLGYPVYVLQKLMSKVPDAIRIGVLYDISCVLHRNLQINMVTGDNTLDRMQFAIPAFHAYGHRVPCQVKYGVSRSAGFGLCDGEGMERLWSYLRPFSRITKEMTPSHRIDLLTDALLHYAHRKKSCIVRVLLAKMKTACDTISYCSTELQKICLDQQVSMSVICSWFELEKSDMDGVKHSSEASSSETWQENYVTLLLQLEASRSAIEAAQLTNDVGEMSKAKNLKTKVEKKTTKIEKQHRVSRWSTDSTDFKYHQHRILQRRLNNLRKDLNQLAQERIYLLELKKKYAVGQKVFIRLNRQLQHVNKKIRSSVQGYNSSLSILQNTAQEITVEEVHDVNAAFYNPETNLSVSTEAQSCIPSNVKRQAINLYQKLLRAREEECIVPQEMSRYSNYLLREHDVFLSALTKLDEGTQQYKLVRAGCGSICQKMVELEKKYLEASCFFSDYVDMPPIGFSMNAEIESFEIRSEVSDQMMQCTISDFEQSDSDCTDYDEDTAPQFV